MGECECLDPVVRIQIPLSIAKLIASFASSTLVIERIIFGELVRSPDQFANIDVMIVFYKGRSG